MNTQNIKQLSTSSSGYLSWRSNSRALQIEVSTQINIGRAPSNHIVLDDEYVSSRNAKIERANGVFVLRDLRSRNGTYINGTRVNEAHLKDGDRIRIGHTEILFTWRKTECAEISRELTSKNKKWGEQLQRLPIIAKSNYPVLLLGPSGSGKDVIAQAIHRLSSRSEGPFVSVNCSALSEALVESELFGHIKGSFTGAMSDRKGAFEAARGGTLFLDEIGDLPLSLQPKLLRALENNQIRAVGSDQSTETNVRIIAATHHDLKKLIYQEKFRSDLYYRLHVVQLQTPSLVERMEDFETLFYTFARQHRVRFAFAAIESLKRHSWPGNIRELKNVVARAKAYWPDDEVSEQDVPQLIDIVPSANNPLPETFKPSRSVIKEIEAEMIRSRLIVNRGNQRKTANELGMPKSTLHDRIKHYGIDVREFMNL